MANAFMKILQKIRGKSEIKTQEIQSEAIRKRWAYELSIDQVALIFEANNLKCFGIDYKKEHAEFIKEYNQLFNPDTDNKNNKQFNTDRILFKMQLKQQKLKAMHDALTACDVENSRNEFREMFGKDYDSIDDLKLLVDEFNRLSPKIKILAMFILL